MNEIYDTFLKTLTDIYDANFPIREYILKDKDIKSPWISKGLKKSSKTKKGYTSKLLHKYETYYKRVWQVMKEITEKQKTKSNPPGN